MVAPFLADVSLTHPFIGNVVYRDRSGAYQGKNLSQRAQFKSLTHTWAEHVHVVVHFFGHAGEYVWGECRDAVPGCLVSGRARSAVLRGRLDGLCWDS